MERKQFTFYASYYDAIRLLPTAEEKAAAYDVIAMYALTGEAPDVSSLPPSVQIIFNLTRPTLDTGRSKAVGGAKKKEEPKTEERPEEDTDKIEARPQEDGGKEKEREGEIEIEKESSLTPQPPKGAVADGRDAEEEFRQFYNAYPRKVAPAKTRAMWLSLFRKGDLPPLSVLMRSLEAQIASEQWKRSGGRYIPYPENWLRDRRWGDVTGISGIAPPGSPSPMAQAAVREMLKKGGGGGGT